MNIKRGAVATLKIALAQKMNRVGAALLVTLVSASASAKMVVYSAKPGDTPESIAADYYGNRSEAIFILETNGLERDKPLQPGQRVRIPTAFHYRVHKGDTLEGLAQKFLDDGGARRFWRRSAGCGRRTSCARGRIW